MHAPDKVFGGADVLSMSLRSAAASTLVAAAVLGACTPESGQSQGRSADAEASPRRSPGSSGELSPAPQAGDDPSPEGGGTPHPSPGPVGVSQCPGGEAVVADARKRAPGRLRGDVDGDGRTETVWLAIDDQAEAGCQVFLAVGSGSVVRTTPVVQPELNLTLSPPSLVGLVPVDSEPGLEVVVDLVTGASTRFAGLFAVRGTDLRRIDFDGPGSVASDLFAYGGSVTHLDGVDCARPRGTLVVTSATPRADRYAVVRRYYRVIDGGAAPVPRRTEHHVVEPKALNRYPELVSPPFAGCLASSQPGSS